MNWRAIWAIVRKDIKVVLQNKGVVIPIILLPVILFVMMPMLAGLVPTMFVLSPDAAAEMDQCKRIGGIWQRSGGILHGP